jgi:hypothetical protein
MVKVILDASVLARLNNPDGPVEVCDESGSTVGYFQPVYSPTGSGEKPMSPFSDEELRRRQQESGGRSLEEILADLENR